MHHLGEQRDGGISGVVVRQAVTQIIGADDLENQRVLDADDVLPRDVFVSRRHLVQVLIDSVSARELAVREGANGRLFP